MSGHLVVPPVFKTGEAEHLGLAGSIPVHLRHIALCVIAGKESRVHVLATAGHVDHGKSALVRALTGIEPDRWEAERQRGLTIDLGYAWTTLPSGEQIAFVDVPGHERFIGNMLAGVGPVPAVVFVVAADEGWRQQSAEHLAAIDALGVSHGLLVVTRSDLADPSAALAEGRERLAATSLGEVEAVAVSSRTGAGLDALRDALGRLVATLPEPIAEGRLRLWVDRAFTIRGSGTVVTGTLAQGSVRVGDSVEVHGTVAGVRGLQSLERAVEAAAPVCRVAVNLRGVPTSDVARGDALVSPGAWRFADVVDVRVRGAAAADLAPEVLLHVGTAAVAARVRPLGGDAVRLTLARALPLVAGDRAIVRDPGSRAMAGIVVLDADPPALRRRGDAARWAAELDGYTGVPDLAVETGRRGAIRVNHAALLGIPVPQGDPPPGLVREGDWVVAQPALDRWAEALRDVLATQASTHPLQPELTLEAARAAIGVPDRALLPAVARQARCEVRDGRVLSPGGRVDLGAAEQAVRRLEEALGQQPFAAPERGELAEAGLGRAELAAAERSGRLLRLGDEVVLLPDGPARAMRALASLAQPFTLSEARQALGTTRRVAVPLLEYLDRRGWTRRVSPTHREVVR